MTNEKTNEKEIGTTPAESRQTIQTPDGGVVIQNVITMPDINVTVNNVVTENKTRTTTTKTANDQHNNFNPDLSDVLGFIGGISSLFK